MKAEVINGSGSEQSYVVQGATLKCSFGDKESKLNIPIHHNIYIQDKAQANIMDFKPNYNIMPFGKCSSLANPTVAAATAANKGKLKKMPCVPLLTIPWINGKNDVVMDHAPALLNKSTNMCMWCGRVTIEDDGQLASNGNMAQNQNNSQNKDNVQNKQGIPKKSPSAKPECYMAAAPPKGFIKANPYALPEDKGDILVDGKKYPIYVPEYNGGSNADYRENGWSIVKTKHISSTNTDWLAVIANFESESLDDSSNMSNKNIQDFCMLSLILGFLKGYADNTVTTYIHIEIQKKGSESRAVVQFGTSNAILSSGANMFYASDLNIIERSDYSNRIRSQNFIKNYFLRADKKTYDIKVLLDSSHEKDKYIGYLSIINENVILTPKLYKGDDAYLGTCFGNGLPPNVAWKNDFDLKYMMKRSCVLPKAKLNTVNKMIAPDVKFLSSSK